MLYRRREISSILISDLHCNATNCWETKWRVIHFPTTPLETGGTCWNSVWCLVPRELPDTLEFKFQDEEQGVAQSWFDLQGREYSLLWRAEVQCRWLWVSEYQEPLIFQSSLWINSAPLSRQARGTQKWKESQDQYPCATADRCFKNFAGTALKLDQATMAFPELHFCDRDQEFFEFFQVLNFRRHLRP